MSLNYRYEFRPDELDAIKACTEQHGFAVIKGLLPEPMVERLKAEVRRVIEPVAKPEPGSTSFETAFVEQAPEAAVELLRYEPYMRIARHMHNNEPIALHRSAAIYKKPGAGVHAWHTDWDPLEHPYGVNGVLNNTGAASMWFYLNGSHPDRGGLSLIPDSHFDDWSGPEGFSFTERRKSFYRSGTEPKPYQEMDVPGAIPLHSEPGDLVLFAKRTYHGVYPHGGDELRLTCAIGFRPAAYRFPQIWPTTESAKAFIAACPADLQELVQGYTGIDGSWKSSE